MSAKKPNKSKQKEPAKMGRPPVVIDWDEFDKLAVLQCTLPEFAYFFKCDPDTVNARCKEEKGMTFSAYFEQRRAGGFISLRRAMYNNAVHKNSSDMQKHLSKNILGYADKVDQTVHHSGQINSAGYSQEEMETIVNDPSLLDKAMDLAEELNKKMEPNK